MADYTYYEGGPDIIAQEGQFSIVTDLIRGQQYEIQVIDFYIDEMMNGYVYFMEQKCLDNLILNRMIF
jgi:hypothetical protein